MNQYDPVRVIAIRHDRFGELPAQYQRQPTTGDIGTIVEVWHDAFEVECSDGDTGFTIWLETMFPEELEPA